MAKAMQVDFTNVKEGGGLFNKVHKPEGDYAATIIKVEDAKTKQDKRPMWLFTIKVGAGTYPFYCGFNENELWKIRNLCVAAGLKVPRKRVKVDPNKLVGKQIAVTLQDTEWDGKMQSELQSTFPLSELEDYDEDDLDDDEDDDEDKDEEEEVKPKKKKKKVVEEDDDDDDEEDDDEDDDDEDEDEEEEKPKKKKKKKKDKVKDELEELDIEDI